MRQEFFQPQAQNKQEIPERAQSISRYVEKIISDGSLDSKATAEFSEIFKLASDAEKATQIFDSLMDYVWTKKAIREEKATQSKAEEETIDEQIDPYFIAKLKYLWSDEKAREIFLKKYQEDHEDNKEAGISDFSREGQRINIQVEQKEKVHKELEQALFLGKITRPDQLSAAKTKLSLLAKQLIDLHHQKEDFSNLKMNGKELEAAPENTDILAQADFEKIQKYHQELNSKDRFVWLPHFKENLLPKILNAIGNTKKFPMLIGEAGSGKTNLVKATAKLLTGENELEEGCTTRTNETDLISDTKLQGASTFEKYGKIVQAFTGYEDSRQEKPVNEKGRVVFLEELLKVDLDKVFSIVKTLAQKRVGDDFDSEIRKKVLPGSALIAATNPPGTRHNLPQIPPAFEREFTMIEVDYPPMTQSDPQLYDFMRAALVSEQGTIAASRKELSPAFASIEIADGRTLEDGRKIIGEEKIIEDPTDKKHGYLYRLSFALKALQDSYVSYGQVGTGKDLLRYTTNSEGVAQIAPSGGEMLTLSKAIITLKDIDGFMQGFKNRHEKADENFQTESLAEFMRFKLEKFLAEANQEDQLKLRAIFNYFHLLDELSASEKAEIKNSEPITAKEIGYLSPTVPRPLKLIIPQEKNKSGEKPIEQLPETISPLESNSVMLESGEMIKIKDYSFEFQKDYRTILVRKNVSFKIGTEEFYFAGIVADKQNLDAEQLVVQLASEKKDEQLFRIMTRAEIESGEFPEMSVEIAREIMERGGKEFFLGPADIENAFGISLSPENIEPIPFSREKIESAQKQGFRLEYFLDEMADGMPFNLENMAKKAIAVLGSNVIEKDADGKPSKYLLYNGQFEDNGNLKSGAWFKSEAGVLSEKPRRGWRLSSAEVLPDTKNKPALAQIETLIENAKLNFFEGEFPAEYLEAEKEFKAQKEKIEKLIKANDYVKASNAIARLKISELLGENISELFFSYLVSFKKGKQLFADGTYARAMLSTSSDGGLLDFGLAVATGAGVSGNGPDSADGDLGAESSRRK